MKIYRQSIPINISPAFIFFLCAFYYFDPADSFFPFLFSVTAHEAGHLMALYFLHVPIRKLSVTVSGAVLETDVLPYRSEIIAAAAGPAVNLLMFVSCLQKYPIFSLVNLCLLLYNLLPFYPLDGGRILRAILLSLFQPKTADILEKCIMLTGMISLTACSVYLTCVWHAGLWPVILCAAIFLKIAGSATFSIIRVDKTKTA